MKLKLSLAFQVSIALIANAQQTTFQKIIGYYAYDAHKVVNGTGYVFGGISSIPTAGVRNCCMIRTDVNGDTLWTSNWGGVAGSCDQQYINDLCPVSDGGAIANGGKQVCGDSTTGGAIVRVDAFGNVRWAKCFSVFCDPYPCIQSKDGNFISGGYISPLGGFGAASPFDAYLTKLDSATGDTIWSKSYGGAGTIDWFYHILQTADGGYLAAGKTNSFGQGGLDVYLVKTDSAGNLMWSKTYGTAAYDETAFGHCLQPTSDGGYIITGQSSGTQGIFLLKVDGMGTMNWAKYYDGLWAHGVKQTSDGGYIVSGTISNGSNGQDVVLIKTDGNGNVAWSKAYGGSGREQGLILELADDGGYLAGGSTTSFNTGLYLVKTDSSGASGCNETNAGVTSGVAPFVEADAATQVSRGANTVNYAYLFARGDTTIDDLCSTVGINEQKESAVLATIFPNPFSFETTMSVNQVLKDATLTVYNSLGQQAKQIINISEREIKLQRENLAGGIYFIRLTQGNDVLLKNKLIITD